MATHYRSCTLCEATCGVAIDVDGDRVVAIRGDAADPFSRGYLCPKATALADLHHDPDRLRRPIARDGAGWRELDWDEALDLVGDRLRAIRDEHGPDAIGVYQGNPTAHNLGLMTHGQLLFRRALRTRNSYSATSLDQLPHMLAAMTMFGDQVLMPVPDVDRADFMLVLGANPAVSNGSIMTAPDIRGRLKAIRARGGQVVVVDPRRTETAELASRHVFIRPGTDPLLLLSMIQVVYAEGRVRAAAWVDGVERLGALAQGFTPEVTAAATGIDAGTVRELARALASTERAVCYGRLGICTVELGGLAAWLVCALNVVTGHLDTPGGLMFTTPAVDAVPLARRLGFENGLGRWKSRVRGLPEFGGELPAVTMADELETPGEGRVRALVTAAGNPVLSTPGGRRLDRALATLDFMVSIDPYLNETTRHAHVILPPTSPLERDHYDLALAMYAVRNVARYAPPVFERGADQRHDWEICAELSARLLAPGGLTRKLATRALRRTLLAATPARLVGAALRVGPHGLVRGREGVSMADLRAAPHGLDLGPLEPRLPGRLATDDRRVKLVPDVYRADLPRLEARMAEWSRARTAAAADGPLTLVGRRHLRSNNSWLHNSARMVKGKPRCTLLVHPRDAAARGLADGALARLRSATGEIVVPVEVTDEIMAGVVSLPHGWGHDRPGARLRVASAHAGASVNDVNDPAFVDELSGTAALSGLTVTVERAVARAVDADGAASGEALAGEAGAS
ncbi:MAG TPA: molybdopterin-dependent oxidoreductase [Kofleriaceae bacterium]|nr:molybdopterin-dependent oxidoreductase [Kofleriaceae bacterium]